MTISLFDDAPEPEPAPKKRAKSSAVMPAQVSEEIQFLAQALPPALRLGTSSWTFPGWADLVWDQPYPEAKLSREGLQAYSQHPLLRTVSLDRAFYRPMTAEQYAALAAQVSDDFRFVVKVPSMISDAWIRRAESEHAGQGLKMNPYFLDAALFGQVCLQPVLQGLGNKLGALVLQMSPLPTAMLSQTAIFKLFGQLAGVLSAQSAIKNVVNHAVIALEVRNPELILGSARDDLIALLKDTGAAYCLGGHAKMPTVDEQLPILRKLWPGPLVCRWNLNNLHGRFGYQAAKDSYAPFSKLIDEDHETRDTLARVIAGTLQGGQRAFVTINNKAEGSAPLSVIKLAQAVAQKLG
jgi:uncharacterized protein YecE (DUF72 family)